MSRPHNTEGVFRALAHPTRRRVIEVLRKGERKAGDLVFPGRGSFAALSEHLKILRVTGLVSCRRRGTSFIYRLNRPALAAVSRWLSLVETPASSQPA